MTLQVRLWRRVLTLRFRLLHQHRHRQLILEHINGRDFVVLPDVFNPGLFRTSIFLTEQFADHIPPGATVLDMGTGSGIGAIFAAQYARCVTAVDINPEAVRCARINVLLNQLEDTICVKQSDLFAAIPDGHFDVVLFNPPYYHGAPKDLYDHAWRSEDTVERFTNELANHLTENGFALVVLSTDGETPAFLQTFESAGFCVETIAEKNLINEVVSVFKLTLLNSL